MSVDLTCPTCRSTQIYFGVPVGSRPCSRCTDGRRPPTLDEWDRLLAERDRYAAALREIQDCPDEGDAGNPGVLLQCHDEMIARARAALSGEDTP